MLVTENAHGSKKDPFSDLMNLDIVGKANIKEIVTQIINYIVISSIKERYW